MLPKFGHMRPVGSIYTTSLNVWPRNFDEGFLNVTDQFEWFAIEYTGRFWLENSGHFGFSLLADNGAKLYLDNEVVIDNEWSAWRKGCQRECDPDTGCSRDQG